MIFYMHAAFYNAAFTYVGRSISQIGTFTISTHIFHDFYKFLL